MRVGFGEEIGGRKGCECEVLDGCMGGSDCGLERKGKRGRLTRQSCRRLGTVEKVGYE